MRSLPIRRKVVLLLLTTFLATTPAWAADRLTPLDFLSRLWSSLTAAWGEEGCYIDPDGCANAEQQPPADERDTGCYIDPDGCANAEPEEPATDRADEGCYIDPSGNCRA